MTRVINRIIQGLGKKGYEVDNEIRSWDLWLVVFERFVSLLRGVLLRPRLRSNQGMLFLGKRCIIRHPGMISFGRTILIEDNVEINALSRHGITMGNNVTIKRNTIIECTGVLRDLGEGLVIGNNVGIAQGCFIQVRGKVEIGSNIMFGPNVSIFSENHQISSRDKLLIDQATKREGVRIEDDVWIGTRSIILDGVTVGRGSVVGAGSIVTKDIPPYSIVAGAPAKVIRTRS